MSKTITNNQREATTLRDSTAFFDWDTFNKRLGEMMEKLELGQAELADAIGMDRVHFHNLLKGARKPSGIQWLSRIGLATGWDIRYLVGLSNIPVADKPLYIPRLTREADDVAEITDQLGLEEREILVGIAKVILESSKQKSAIVSRKEASMTRTVQVLASLIFAMGDGEAKRIATRMLSEASISIDLVGSSDVADANAVASEDTVEEDAA